jgi:hypothetical protein
MYYSSVIVVSESNDTELAYSPGIFPGYVLFIAGLEFIAPIALVIILTPQRVFNFMAWRFDGNRENLERDGAFIAELLDNSPIKVNSRWYIHYDKAGLPTRDEFDDYQKFWYQGKIISVEDNHIKVMLNDIDSEIELPIKGNNCDSKTLLDEARKNLRCIDWDDISIELFTSSVRDISSKPCYEYSRQVNNNEIIDYFISHSWSDCGEAKYRCLQQLANTHYKKYHRYPTFWFDKVQSLIILSIYNNNSNNNNNNVVGLH